MNKIRFLIFVCIIFLTASCSKEIKKKSIIQEKSIELQVLESYREGLKELETGDALYAAKKFNEVETMFPQSDWAPKSTLMAAYAYYSQNYYFDASEELKIYIKKYPNHEDNDYAHYLLGVTYYEQIVDEKKDLESIMLSKKKFEYVIKNFPNTDYALDAKFKLDLIFDMLASKEMYIGRYYLEKKKWIAAINRFKKVADEYETTIYVEEALHRLVEIYYTLGLVDESKKYAKVLGYNYKSSKWYENSYIVFNKTYKREKLDIKKKKKKESIIKKKFKSLFD
tara:strand:- start:215 stop:1060 length:846 start_codon:yes stop_codon:yes gene_type:complete